MAQQVERKLIREVRGLTFWEVIEIITLLEEYHLLGCDAV
jgi:hypothetical protein